MKPSRLWNLPVRFIRRSSAERRLFVEALCWLAVTRLAILTVPFRRIAPFLGQKMLETPVDSLDCRPPAREISWAVQTAGRYTPWESKCLAQAIAGKMMLRRRGLASTLYLGLSKQGPESLSAHAWLRCGDRILTGAPVHREFTVIAAFGD